MRSTGSHVVSVDGGTVAILDGGAFDITAGGGAANGTGNAGDMSGMGGPMQELLEKLALTTPEETDVCEAHETP